MAVAWLFGLCLTLVAGATQATQTGSHDYRIVGYVGNAQPLPAISAGKLDAINFAFATLSPAGEVVLSSPTAAQSLTDLLALRKLNPRLQILASVGGWGADHFSEAAWDSASRSRFADSAVHLLEQHHLDGLDIDWEYPTLAGPGISHHAEDRGHFSLLLEAVRKRLDQLGAAHGGKHYLLTIAAADGEFVAGIELKRAAQSLDWINLMTYDFHNGLTPSTGHHAGLHLSALAPANDRAADKAVQQFLAAGVPASKLVLGVAFYGRAFGGVDPQHDGLQQKYTHFVGAPSWRELKADYLTYTGADNGSGKNGYVRHWDDQAQAPYLWNAKTQTFISYDDPQSLRAKTAYIKANRLGGVMYWEHSLDQDEQLLDVLHQGLAKP
ncbi:glycoside hydrolase family 18 protein [Dyella silvatica]|uniref:glycoside hydrolase family 18 protein n=1 Tax=Dyella silvatica TaxID=2992128 RepID=UPI002253D6CC|nr:glycoside hydrolase family 18 protein [Dyella silvatica]